MPTTRYDMRDTRYEKGFTLVELLVALVVTGIVLAAVATLAFAMGAANDATDDTSQKQAQVRYATLRISELIRHCKLICGTPGDDLAIWQADDDNGQININELVYIERGPSGDHIRLYECNSVSNPVITLSDIDAVGTSWWLGFYDSETYVELLPQCSNVQFGFLPELPPKSRFVTISFDVVENDTVRRYQISTSLRGWAGNLLDGSGNIVSDDD